MKRVCFFQILASLEWKHFKNWERLLTALFAQWLGSSQQAGGWGGQQMTKKGPHDLRRPSIIVHLPQRQMKALSQSCEVIVLKSHRSDSSPARNWKKVPVAGVDCPVVWVCVCFLAGCYLWCIVGRTLTTDRVPLRASFIFPHLLLRKGRGWCLLLVFIWGLFILVFRLWWIGVLPL